MCWIASLWKQPLPLVAAGTAAQSPSHNVIIVLFLSPSTSTDTIEGQLRWSENRGPGKLGGSRIIPTPAAYTLVL